MKRNPKVTSDIMSKIRSINTKPEIIMEKELKKLKIKFKKQYRIEGRPDFAFPKEKIAIFCDGDFWHGNNWRIRGYSKLEDDIKSNRDYWITKIKTNVKRDRRVNKKLKREGWKVLRFWESDIKNDPEGCAKSVKDVLDQRRP